MSCPTRFLRPRRVPDFNVEYVRDEWMNDALGVAQRKTLPLDNIEADRAGFDPRHADHDEEGRAEEVHDPRRFKEKVNAWRHCVRYEMKNGVL